MTTFFLIVLSVGALIITLAAASLFEALRRAASGNTSLLVEARPGSPGEDIALYLTFSSPQGGGRAHVKAVAAEGDLARALDLGPPEGFAPYNTEPLRYEDFEPDLDEIADRLDLERPDTTEISKIIDQAQHEQFEDYQRQREGIDAVQFTGNLMVGSEPVRLRIPGRAIPEAAGKIWITTQRRVGAATVDDVVVVELPFETA